MAKAHTALYILWCRTHNILSDCSVCVMESVKCLDMSVCRLSYHRHKIPTEKKKLFFSYINSVSHSHTDARLWTPKLRRIYSARSCVPSAHFPFQTENIHDERGGEKKKKSVDGMRSVVVGLNVLYSCLCDFFRCDHHHRITPYDLCTSKQHWRLILQRRYIHPKRTKKKVWKTYVHHTKTQYNAK